MSERIIGIMGAIPQEINGVVSLLSNKKEVNKKKKPFQKHIVILPYVLVASFNLNIKLFYKLFMF